LAVWIFILATSKRYYPPSGCAEFIIPFRNRLNYESPIGSGLGILLALGAAYGGKKVWDYRRKLEE
jgi:hypothetical protein